MTADQFGIVAVLIVTMGLFISNIWRYDIVAGFSLLAAVTVGAVPMDHAFDGFSHPAVVTVACVLIISQALQSSGVVEFFLRYLRHARRHLITQIAANTSITALLSAFMNNIGALALMLPVTLRDAQQSGRPVSRLLMPLSFASLLGGLVTMIGTPPNIIIATFRADNGGEPFRMFDFTPVGLSVALAGLLYLVLIGWRLLPDRGKDQSSVLAVESSRQSDSDDATLTDEPDYRLAEYITELRIPSGSKLVGSTVRRLEKMCGYDISVMGIIRNERRRLAPASIEPLVAGDVLLIQGDSDALQPLFEDPGLIEAGAEGVDPDWLKSADVIVIEAVVMPSSVLESQSVRAVKLHQRFGVNLLGIARQGHAARSRLKFMRFRIGDVLLLQGEVEALKQLCSHLGCLAIRDRGLDIAARRGAIATPALFAAGIIAAAFGLVPVQIAFFAVVGILVLMKLVSLREAYRSIEWPVLVLLGCLIPVGEALQSTGTTMLIGDGLASLGDGASPAVIIGLLLVVSMLLSDVIHNTPTAVLMAPIAWSLCGSLGISPDAGLMAVAVGAASPYLTPIGHQSNTLVMGPGGYRFGDYVRMGLALDVVIVAVAVPAILWFWT